jgi:hypothetical protein
LEIIKPVPFTRNQPAPLNYSLDFCWEISIQMGMDVSVVIEKPGRSR